MLAHKSIEAKEHDNHDDRNQKLAGNQMIYHPVLKHGQLENALCTVAIQCNSYDDLDL